MTTETELRERLAAAGQAHLWHGWETLSAPQQAAFLAQLREIELDRLAVLRAGYGGAEETPAQKAARATPPSQVVRRPRTPEEQAAWNAAAARGEELLRAGKVGVILVAGGQGTRLGYSSPKGMFPIGPVSGSSLFRLLAEQALARGRRAGKPLPYCVMTSDATHAETVAFFEQEHHFGLDPAQVRFFQQGTMPAVDAVTGALLLAGPGQLALSPDGHGGVLQALNRAGLLQEMADQGIEYIYYHQVDNPLAIVCDPAFIGLHDQHRAEVSTKVVPKTGPEEKMGVVAEVDGVAQIIEYSDLPAEIAARRTADGELEFWAGNTAIHLFSLPFLNRLARGPIELPFHVAHKAVPYLDEQGTLVNPEKPNAYKFERFIFDVLPLAERTLVVEADREREFNPVKNATGVNSPDDVRRSLCALHRGWLHKSGRTLPENCLVEISPLFALDEQDLCQRADLPETIADKTFLCG